ncbi:putative beta-lactamase-like 1 [Orbicella faveolata]|uniref:putative beta-lactamase-like 1 n=1 Tax=Orbicella faveolata TaxID=48498 RepID=UPI0009E60DE2|nr:putative beta-lactamase-like 1 [Orbicella faveolata]
MLDSSDVSILGKKKQPSSYLKLWKILAVVSTLVAVAVTAVLIWYVLSHKSDSESNEQEAVKNIQDTLECPQLPTLLPLPKPTPERITEVFQKLESALSALIDKGSSLPAISMNVFYQGEILWSGHFGSKMYKQPGKKPNDSTVYRIGSVTKIFPVLMMYKFYEEGKISSIDDPLSKYAPNFFIKNPYTNENISLREIASQMSGLPREAPCLFSCNTTSAEQLALLKNRSLILPPWVQPSYSNLGYGLLGRLLTENLLQNETFESWTRENILKPLGMVNTGFEITDEVKKNMAYPYLCGGKRTPFMEIGWLAPAGQMYSTIDDLAKLGMMFAEPEKQKLFKPATLREMMTPKDITPDGVTLWGSPFEMTFKEHVLVRVKEGNIDTYNAKFTVIPELALGANILTSSVYYVQQDASKVSTLLYSLLIPRLNKTLFELQREFHFPINPAPFTGKFQVKQGNSVFGTIQTYNVTISEYQNILRSTNPHSSSTTEIRYIGEKLVFQARSRYPGTSCLMERFGTLADMYYDPPEKDKLSHGFYVPQWEIVAKRVKATSDSFADESEGNMEEFLFNPFKRALL